MNPIPVQRTIEHLNLCNSALSNVGADGVNQLQMHLRLATEWAMHLTNELQKTGQFFNQPKVAEFANAVIRLNNTTVDRLPEAIAELNQQAWLLPKN